MLTSFKKYISLGLLIAILWLSLYPYFHQHNHLSNKNQCSKCLNIFHLKDNYPILSISGFLYNENQNHCFICSYLNKFILNFLLYTFFKAIIDSIIENNILFVYYYSFKPIHFLNIRAPPL